MGNMMKEFIKQNYLIIEHNVVLNVCVWDGNTDEWTPPLGSIALAQSSTPALVWRINTATSPIKWELTEVIGAGDIGFTWDGTVLTTNAPEPAPITASENQPQSTGTTTI